MNAGEEFITFVHHWRRSGLHLEHQDRCGGLEAEKILITTLSRRNHQNIDRLLEAVAAQLILAD